MYKAEDTDNNMIVKSHNIIEVWDHVVKNPSPNYQFYVDYTPYTKFEFSKLFLQQSNSYEKYLLFNLAIHKETTLIDYANGRN